ncbi:MAG: uroporphyrinogen decarboxylase family protein [Chloroflexota bacterium]
MKHRDRVQIALNREVPDRCPMQISFTPEFAARLRKDMGITDDDAHNPNGAGNSYQLERSLDEDILLTSVGWSNSYHMDDKPYTDEWGVGWDIQAYETPFGAGNYTEITSHPLADDQKIDSYVPPDPTRLELYVDSEQMIREYKDEYWITGVTVTTIFETAWALRGFEQLMVDMAIDPDTANQILEIPYQYHLSAAKKLTELGVDMIWTGDDIGAQNKMLISPKMWRQYFKPRMADFIAELKAINPDLKIAYHSDGNVLPVIPELIEIGVDVLNPIQPASMDPAEIKRKFGDQLCFWGTIDEQHTLPFGSPEDVKTEVVQRLQTVGVGGGLILAPTHFVQLDTPLENFWAMVNTITNTPY